MQTRLKVDPAKLAIALAFPDGVPCFDTKAAVPAEVLAIVERMAVREVGFGALAAKQMALASRSAQL